MENLMYKDWKAENEAKIGMRFGEVKSSGLEHVEPPLELSSSSTTTRQSSLVNGGGEAKDAEEEEEEVQQSDYDECAFVFFSPVEMPGEPAILKEALESSDAEEWKKAMESELKSIEENGMWELVELPEGRKAITSKWLFKIKSDADGNIERYKSRLVAKGYQQKEKVDYKELFAPVVKPTSLRTLLAGAAIKGWVVKQMDVTMAFLNGVLEEEIFMAQPEGDIKDGVSLFDHVSGAATALPTTADDATRSQWLSRDAAARLAIRNHLPLAECAHFGQHRTTQALYDAVVARYSSPATASLGRLLLPYLFPDLSSFATVEDLISHLRASDARYRAAVPAEFFDKNQPPMFITLYFIVTRLPDSLCSVRDHFLSLDPTSLTVLLVALRARPSLRGAPPPPFHPPTPLLLLLTSLLLRTSGQLLLVRSAAAARARVARVARVVEVAAAVVEVAAGVVGGAAVEVVAAVGLLEGVGALVAAVEAAVGVAALEAAVGVAAVEAAVGVAAVEAAVGVAAVEAVGLVEVGLELSVVASLRERFGQDLPVLCLHTNRGVDFFSNLLRDFFRGEGILQSFTLPESPQQNGIAERLIGLVMEVTRTSMIHAATPHFLWPFAVRYAAHQLNLWPRVFLPETSPTMRWTGEVGNASVFRVWGSRAFVRDTSTDKLSPRVIPCVFLGFVPDAPGLQFYHPTSRCVLPSQDVTFDESLPFYRLFPFRSAPPPPLPLFLAPSPPLVDPLPPQGPSPSGVSEVDPLPGPAPVQVTVGSSATRGAASGGAVSGGAEPGGAESEGAETGGAEPRGVGTWGSEPRGVEPGDCLRSSCVSGLIGAHAFVVELPELDVLELLEQEVLELLLELVLLEGAGDGDPTEFGATSASGSRAGGAGARGAGVGGTGIGDAGVGGSGVGGA
ncbi:unnamed protein product [Closterium sp. NIES-54]